MFTKDNMMIWLKDGKIHDEAREEMKVKVDNQYKKDLLKMLHFLGYEEQIKWYRIRNEGTKDNMSIAIDYSYGYGYIIEIEMLVNDEVKVNEAKTTLTKLFKNLNIEITDKQMFNDKYNDYKINWQDYTKDINEDIFLD